MKTRKLPPQFARKHVAVIVTSERGIAELMGRLHNAFDLEGCKDKELRHIYDQLSEQFSGQIRHEKEALKFSELLAKKLDEVEVTPRMKKVAAAGAELIMSMAGIKPKKGSRHVKAKV